MIKKMICIMIVVSMLAGISACSKKKNAGGSGKGKETYAYVEKEIGKITGLEQPGMARVNSKNQLVIHNASSIKPEYLIIGTSGELEGKITCSFEGKGDVFTLDEKDNLYIVAVLYNETGFEQILYVIDPQGNPLKTIKIDQISHSDSNSYEKQITGISVDRAGNLMLSKISGGFLVMDKDGNEKGVLGQEILYGVAHFDWENNLIAYGLNASDYKYAMEKLTIRGERLWKRNVEQSQEGLFSFSVPKISCDFNDGSIYLLKDSGIAKFDKDGNELDKAVDFRKASIFASGLTITDMCMGKDKTFYVKAVKAGPGGFVEKGIAESMEYAIYQYSLQKVSEEKKIPITISVPSSGRLLDMAVSKFTRENPGYEVIVQEYAAGRGEGKYDQYINALNTELMSGKGPDIISVAGLPYEKYIAKNMFVDLTQMIEKDGDFQRNRFYTNLFEAMKHNGRLYHMPIHVTVNAMFANKKALSQRSISVNSDTWTWRDFTSIAQRITGNEPRSVSIVPPDISDMDMLQILLQCGGGRFIDRSQRKADFSSEEFIELLQAAKKLGTNTGNHLGANASLFALFNVFERGTVLFSPQSMGDFMMLSTIKALYASEFDILNLPSSGIDAYGGSFACSESYAINTNSVNQQKAWEFIKILLSDEIQSMDELAGFPVSKAAFKMKADKNYELLTSDNAQVSVGFSADRDPITPKPLAEKEVSNLERYIQDLTVYTSIDRKVLEMIQAEAQVYFSGERSDEDTARAIQSKVNIYLGE